MATIISFSEVCDMKCIKVVFNSEKRIHFDVTLPNGVTYRFKRVNSKLFYFDMEHDKTFNLNIKSKTPVTE